MNLLTPLNTIHLWNINDYEVRLIQNHDQLFYETFDTLDKKVVYKNSIPLNASTSELVIPLLKNCRIRIGEDGKVCFLKNYKLWNVNDYDVNLIKRV